MLVGTEEKPGVEGTNEKDNTNENEEESADEDDEDEDEFECDIEKYVKFEEKLEFAERLKTSKREVVTQIIKLLTEIQPQGIDDYGNSRVQLKIDMIEKDAYLKCLEILGKGTTPNSQEAEE